MGFLRYANAIVAKPVVSLDAWDHLLQGSLEHKGIGQKFANNVKIEEYNPDKYMLSHVTIVASVDTENSNAPLGQHFENGFQVNRKYADWLVTPQTTKYFNNNCFIPGTLITMSDGTVKPIEAICVGDEVLTHLGRAQKVTQVFQRTVDESLLKIKPRGTTERLCVTKEHPFFVFRPVPACVHCGTTIHRNQRSCVSLLGRFYCTKECYYAHHVPNKKLLHTRTGEFVCAKDLTDRDFTSMPVLSGTTPTGLTPGQARLIGLFAAEGYYELYSYNANERVGVIWAFNKIEQETLAADVVRLLQSEFGVTGVIRQHSTDNGIHVTTNVNRDLVTFFSRWVHGEDSCTKYLDKDLMTAERDVQLEVARGWFEGDGSYIVTPHDSRLVGASACRSLANQMQLLLHRLGVSSHLTLAVTLGRKALVENGTRKVIADPTKECRSWQVSCGSGWVAELIEHTKYEHLYDSDVQKVPYLCFLNGYHIQIIEDIQNMRYSGVVHNFDVEDDHSYIANGVAVHNCDAWERKLLLSSYKTFIGGENYCFVPGTKITMADGTLRAIQDIIVGDTVISHTGSARKVVHTFVRDYVGDLKGIRVDQTKSLIFCTPNHPFFSADQGIGAMAKVRADSLVFGSFLFAPGIQQAVSITEIEVKPYNGKVHNIEVEEDHSYIVEGLACGNCEHVQVPELSKGKIIDAAARDIGDSVYIDILVATEKKHRALIAAIQEKRLTTLSMGCSVSETTCTKCGNVATDEPTLCKHVRFEKGSDWYDDFGIRRKTGEICGHISIEPGSVKFIEASWVANPAFTGAVLRSILNPYEAAGMGQKIQVAFSQPVRVADSSALRRAASFVPRINEPSVYQHATNYPARGQRTIVSQDQFDDGFSGAPAAKEDKPEAKKADPIDKAVDDLTSLIRERVVERVRGEIGKDDADRAQHDMRENQNDTLIKSAMRDPAWRRMASLVLKTVQSPKKARHILAGLVIYKQGGWQSVRCSSVFNGADMLVISRFLDIFSQRQILAGERRLYRTVVKVGGLNNYASVEHYLAACRQCLGRKITAEEAKVLIQKGQLYCP